MGASFLFALLGGWDSIFMKHGDGKQRLNITQETTMFSKLKQLLKDARLPSKKPETPVGATAPGLSPDSRTISPDTPAVEKTARVETVERKQPDRKKAQALEDVKRNRKGIRVFDKDQDLFGYFDSAEGSFDEPPEISVEKPGPGPDPGPGKIELKTKARKKTVRKTRQGFPILDGLDDAALFKEALVDDRAMEKPEEPEEKRDAAPAGKRPRLEGRNRHGIPVLPDPGDRSGLIPEALREQEKREFLRLLNQNLGQKTRDVLMNEKGVRPGRKKPLTLKERLRRYPLPQSQLDLHGYTALKAELRAESFLKNAYGNQVHTVIVIVGKGLHSDEGAVLPDVVETLLDRLRREGVVLAYAWINERKSRSGAVTVFLNNLTIE